MAPRTHTRRPAGRSQNVDCIRLPESLRAMLVRLSLEQRTTLARRLHDRLYAPATAAEHRVAELGFLSLLLNEKPQPPERLPIVERKDYEARRKTDAPNAPRAALLVNRYGSWRHACWAAWGLLADGRSSMGAWPWPRGAAGNYTPDGCIDAVRECAEALGRIPTSSDYQQWARTRRRTARLRGSGGAPPSFNVVVQALASDEPDRHRWERVRGLAFGSGT